MTKTDVTLDEALAAAHLPALAAALVHLTGDESLIGKDRWPTYDFFGDSKLGGYSLERQAEIREKAGAAIEAYQAGKPLAPAPTQAVVRRMMDFIAGTAIPEHY